MLYPCNVSQLLHFGHEGGKAGSYAHCFNHSIFNRYPPFFDEHPFRIYEKILDGRIEWPRQVDPQAKDLIKKLLVRDVTRRLGTLKVSFKWY